MTPSLISSGAEFTVFYTEIGDKLLKISPDWGGYQRHRDPLNEIEDYGGLAVIPDDQLQRILRWLVICYLGEPGGYGQWGRNRTVFYSDAAAPIIERLIKGGDTRVRPLLEACEKDKKIAAAMNHQPIGRRFERLLDIIDD